MCGNYILQEIAGSYPQGSPPRVRELHSRTVCSRSALGITPACAGITLSACLISTNFEDHPRVCGNYCTLYKKVGFYPGSPPRVRELPAMSKRPACAVRITPACAGITPVLFFDLDLMPDHPRVCGNYLFLKV